MPNSIRKNRIQTHTMHSECVRVQCSILRIAHVMQFVLQMQVNGNVNSNVNTNDIFN